MAKEGLKEIYQQIIDDPQNKYYQDNNFLPIYSASKNAKILLVGQAPGKKAQESGVTWNDLSGNNLRTWLGVSRDEFYNKDNFALVPMDFFYPGKGKSGDLPPRKGFAEKWHPKLLKELINIKLIVLIGSYAQKYYLKEKAKKNLTLTVFSYEKYLPRFFPLPHPSPLNFRFLKKNPWIEEKVVPNLQKVVRMILNEEKTD